MIIQCRTCQTKYRFDETRILEDGAWVRCTRCQNVFFQHPPLPSLSSLEVNKSAAPDQVVPADLDTVDVGDLAEIPELLDDPGIEKAPETRSAAKKVRAWALGAILILMAAGVGGLFLFPEYGQMAMKELNAYFPGLLSFNTRDVPATVGPAQVKIVDARQRFVNNALHGNIRIVDGVAMNASPYPMTRIKIRGELIDMIGTPVRENASFCGNILTDEELSTLTEEQLLRQLASPQGRDVPNDRIVPNGRIPFMIIFIREPPGVTKTFVNPIAAERLLS